METLNFIITILFFIMVITLINLLIIKNKQKELIEDLKKERNEVDKELIITRRLLKSVCMYFIHQPDILHYRTELPFNIETEKSITQVTFKYTTEGWKTYLNKGSIESNVILRANNIDIIKVNTKNALQNIIYELREVISPKDVSLSEIRKELQNLNKK